MTIRNLPWILAGVFLMAVSACAPSKMKMPMPLTAKMEGVPEKFRSGQILDLKAGKAVTFDALVDRLENARLVFVGENHDNPEHHLIQVQILQELMIRYGVRTVAMEFFRRHDQGVIDEYMEGELDETDFLEAVDWKKSWGFPYYFYRPLILQIREKKGVLLGLNAPREIVRKVARSGLGSLDKEERSRIARDINLNNEEHKAYLKEVFGDDSHHGIDHFDSFYEAQCVWDETMAETIADYLGTHSGPMVVFAGNGHIVQKFGIPDRVKRRMDVPMVTITVYPLTEQLDIDRQMADYLWLTGSCSSRRHPFFRK